jgi:hypothetical protein
MNALSLRQPVWVEIPKESAEDYQLEDTRIRSSDEENQVFARGNAVVRKIRIDFLSEELHLNYRQVSLEKKNDPGIFYFELKKYTCI